MLYPGLEKGFSHVQPVAHPSADAAGPPKGNRSKHLGHRESAISPEEARHHATLVTDAALGWLESRPEGRWFLWVDYESIHEPWRPPEPYASMFDKGYDGPDLSDPRMYEPDAGERVVRHLQALYDGEVVLVDKGVGRILAFLREVDLWEDTLIVLMSDHGVFLGEHGFFKKPPFLFDPLMRSSLIVSWPKGVPAGKKSRPLVQLCDVMPTVLELLGLPLPDGCPGASLAPLLRGAVKKVHDAVFMEFCEYKGTAAKAVRTEDWKYIYHRSVGNIPWSHDYAPAEVFEKTGLQTEMLFNLWADPDELKNLAQRKQDVAQKMRSLLIDWMIDTEDDVPWT
jgi:arylsulfatase A-like enzyme